jgi:hypothetical protein
MAVQERAKKKNVQDYPRSGQPKTQRTDANVDRVRTSVCSNQRLGVRLTAEELNMNRETVQQMTRNVGFTFHLIFYTMQRCVIGSLLETKRGVFIRPGNKTPQHAMENTEFTSAKKSTHVSLTVQDHACVSSITWG